jgi:hypothetical protein
MCWLQHLIVNQCHLKKSYSNIKNKSNSTSPAQLDPTRPYQTQPDHPKTTISSYTVKLFNRQEHLIKVVIKVEVTRDYFLNPYREFENQLTHVRRVWMLIKFLVWSQKMCGNLKKLRFRATQFQIAGCYLNWVVDKCHLCRLSRYVLSSKAWDQIQITPREVVPDATSQVAVGGSGWIKLVKFGQLNPTGPDRTNAM